MNEQIETIKKEINELRIKKDVNEKEYDDIEKLFNKTFCDLEDMKRDLKNLKLCFKNAKDTKIIKLVSLLSSTIMITTFILLNFLFNCPLLDIFLIELVTLYFTATVSICFYNTIFNSVVERYLIKKYPHIRDIYNRINLLTNNISLKEEEFIKLKNKRDNLSITLKSIREAFYRKNYELYYLEEGRLDCSINRIIETESKGNAAIEGKGRSKKRIKKCDIDGCMGN